MPHSKAGEWTRVLVTIENERKSFTSATYRGDRDDYMELNQSVCGFWLVKNFWFIIPACKRIIIEHWRLLATAANNDLGKAQKRTINSL